MKASPTGLGTFAGAIRAFDLSLRAERNSSPETRRAYVSDLRQLATWAGAEADPARVTSVGIRGFLASLHRGRGPATLARKLSAIRAFYAFLMREGVCAADPSAKTTSGRWRSMPWSMKRAGNMAISARPAPTRITTTTASWA